MVENAEIVAAVRLKSNWTVHVGLISEITSRPPLNASDWLVSRKAALARMVSAGDFGRVPDGDI